MSAPKNEISIEDVDQEIASGSRLLAFRPAIERSFEQDTTDERVRMFVGSGTIAIILYDIFLINDYLILNDRFYELVFARLGIFTPTIALTMVVIVKFRNAILRECLVAVGAILGVALPMTNLVFSNSGDRLSYQFGTLLMMLFVTIIQRQRFRYAAFSITIMTSIQIFTTKISCIFIPETFATNVVFFLTAAILLLISAYYLEIADRRTFLFILRGRLLHDQLRRMTQIDPLTGLFNRRHLDEVAKEIWADAALSPRTVSAVLLDVDHFKAFNDAYGHSEGDECLRAVSAIVSRVASQDSGVAFRFGGEEMVVLLSGTGLGDARETAEKIRMAIQAAAIPHPVLGDGMTVSASFGVAGIVAPHAEMAALIEAADTSLYAAKRAGRNCVWPPSGLKPEIRSAVLAA